VELQPPSFNRAMADYAGCICILLIPEKARPAGPSNGAAIMVGGGAVEGVPKPPFDSLKP